MNELREKLIAMIQEAVGGCARHWAELIADHLIANVVTVADGKDTDVPAKQENVKGVEIDQFNKWIPVTERLPEAGEVVLACGKRHATSGMFQGVLRNKPNMWHWKGNTLKEVTHSAGATERRMSMAKDVICKNCLFLSNGWCEKKADSPVPDMVRDCRHFQQKTNADRIRAMSDEDLARWMLRYQRQIIKETLRTLGTEEHVKAFEEALGENPDCTDIVRWLKEPYKEDD